MFCEFRRQVHYLEPPSHLKLDIYLCDPALHGERFGEFNITNSENILNKAPIVETFLLEITQPPSTQNLSLNKKDHAGSR